MSPPPVEVGLTSPALEPDQVAVISFTGREAVSEPYRFMIDLLASDPDLALDGLVGQTATLTIATEDNERRINGLIMAATLVGEAAAERYLYRVTLVPRVAALDLSAGYQIHLDRTAPEIIADELTATARRGLKDMPQVRLRPDDFTISLMYDDYYRYEYKCQYGESDLAFISRLMEHEGLFYYFVQRDGREIMVIGDDNVFFQGASEDLEAFWLTRDAPTTFGQVTAISETVQRTRESVLVNDYNYRMPGQSLLTRTSSSSDGFGTLHLYGENLYKKKQAQRLAAMRAEAEAWPRQLIEGAGNHFGFEPGREVKLSGHFRSDFNRTYRIVAVEHTCVAATVPGSETDEAAAETEPYRNTFTLIPVDTPFRPARKTAVPVAAGVVSAHIDADGEGHQARPDDEGRYKVRMPFDLSQRPPGQASSWIRVATPLSGAGEGMQVPLRKGAEVLVAHEMGDPARPIIVGTGTNPGAKSSITSANPATARFGLAGGVRMTMHDNPSVTHVVSEVPPPPDILSTIVPAGEAEETDPTGTGSTGGGADGDGDGGGGGGGLAATGAQPAPRPRGDGEPRPASLSAAAATQSADTASDHVLDQPKSYAIYVPDYNSSSSNAKDTYLRLGGPPPSNATDANGDNDYDVEVDELKSIFSVSESDAETIMGQLGWFDFTDGGRVSLTEGMRADRVVHNGKQIEMVYTSASSEKAISYGKKIVDFAIDATIGQSLDFFFGSKVDSTFGSVVEVQSGAKTSYSLASDINYTFGLEGNVGASQRFDFNFGPETLELHNEFEQMAKKITLSASLTGVDAVMVKGEAQKTSVYTTMAALIGGLMTGYTAAEAVGTANTEDVLTASEQTGLNVSEGAIEGAIAANVANTIGGTYAYYTTKAAMEAAQHDEPASLVLNGDDHSFSLITGLTEVAGLPTSLTLNAGAAGLGASIKLDADADNMVLKTGAAGPAGPTITMTATTITLAVGDTSLALTQAGVVMKAASLTLTATETIAMTGTDITANGASILGG